MRERQEPVSNWVEEFVQAPTLSAACDVIQRAYTAIKTDLSKKTINADDIMPKLEPGLVAYMETNQGDFDLKLFYTKLQSASAQFRTEYYNLDNECDQVKKKIEDLQKLPQKQPEKVQTLTDELEILESKKGLQSYYMAVAMGLANLAIEETARAEKGYKRSDKSLTESERTALNQRTEGIQQEFESYTETYSFSINPHQQLIIMLKLLEALNKGEELLVERKEKYSDPKKIKEGKDKDKDNDSSKAAILAVIIGSDTDRQTFQGLQNQIKSYIENTSQCKLVNQKERNEIFTNYSALLNDIDQKVIAPLKKQHKERPFLTRLKNWFKHAFPFTHQSTVSVVRDVYSTLSFFHKHAQEKINEVERAAQEKINEVERINKPKIG